MSSLQNSLLSRLRSSRLSTPFPPTSPQKGAGRGRIKWWQQGIEREDEGRNWDFEGLWNRFLRPSPVVFLSHSGNHVDNGCLSKRMSPPALCDSVLLVQCIALTQIWKGCDWEYVMVLHFGCHCPPSLPNHLALSGFESAAFREEWTSQHGHRSHPYASWVYLSQSKQCTEIQQRLLWC